MRNSLLMMIHVGCGVLGLMTFFIIIFLFIDNRKCTSMEFIIMSMFAMTTVFLITMYIEVLNMEWKIEDEPYVTQYIGALNDNNLVKGTSHYARRTYIEEDLYYQYLKCTSDGGYQVTKVRADKATIYEDNGMPRIDWYHKYKTWLIWEWEDYLVKVYLPKGSIIDTYIIDLQ